jgi:hypothetical protein
MVALCRKLLIACIASVPLAGCATDPYSYGDSGYGAYDYGYTSPYYGPVYGPTVGPGLGYSEYDYRRDGDYRHDGHDRRDWRDRNAQRTRPDFVDRRDARGLGEGRALPDYDGPGPGKWERDGHGNLQYAPDGGKDARDANSASPG